jgi:hypothetical protein
VPIEAVLNTIEVLCCYLALWQPPAGLDPQEQAPNALAASASGALADLLARGWTGPVPDDYLTGQDLVIATSHPLPRHGRCDADEIDDEAARLARSVILTLINGTGQKGRQPWGGVRVAASRVYLVTPLRAARAVAAATI